MKSAKEFEVANAVWHNFHPKCKRIDQEINQIHTKAGSVLKEKLEEVVCPDSMIGKAQGKPLQALLREKHH